LSFGRLSLVCAGSIMQIEPDQRAII